MKRRFSASSRFVFYLICLGLLFPNTILAQTGKNFVPVNYSYPVPNATQVSAKTTIGIRYGKTLSKSIIQSGAFNVIGTVSGKHTGKIVIALDGRTVIFTPSKFFFSGEKVLVNIPSLQCISGNNTVTYTFSFQISKSKLLPSSLRMRQSGSSEALVSDISADHLQPWIPESVGSADTLPDDFPAIHITESNDPAPGNIYLADFKFTRNDSGTYLIILDNSGDILFERSTWPAFAQDFRPQPNGMFTYFDADPEKFKFYGLDSNFVLIDSFEAANGYNTDSHELIFLPGGGYALLAQVDETVNLSHSFTNGDSNATVAEGILQEFDAEKNLLFEWRTRDHFAFSDAVHDTSSQQPFLDFTHCNSLDYDFDSTFLLSSRNLDEVTKIDPENGNIIWRWGGKNNQFTFVNDSLIFSQQHAVRRLPDGNITMFDNGTFHPTAMPFSRAIEYRLDEKAKIATKVWEYHHNPDVYGNAMGYVQRLENGNTLIGWGGCDSVAVTEIKPDGSTALEIKFDPGIYSYRAYKFTAAEIKAMQGKAGVSSLVSSSPTIMLEQNYPNPFTTSTTIPFVVGERTQIEMSVYDALGRKVKTVFNGTVDAGSYSAKFNEENLPNGTYFCRLTTPAHSLTTVMVLAK